MGFLEENQQYLDSFSKTICSIKKFEELPDNKEYVVDTDDCGMFDMKSDFDIVTGKYSLEFYDAFGGENADVKMEEFREKLKLLRERFLFEKQLES